jgi:hypothetical protein
MAQVEIRQGKCAPESFSVAVAANEIEAEGSSSGLCGEIPAALLPVTLSGQRLLYSLPLSRLQVKGMFLHFLDDVLLQDLSLEPAEGVLYSLALLKSNLCQNLHTSNPRGDLRLYQLPVLLNCRIVLQVDNPAYAAEKHSTPSGGG